MGEPAKAGNSLYQVCGKIARKGKRGLATLIAFAAEVLLRS